MQIPEQVTVCGVSYTVREVPVPAGNPALDGCCDPSSTLIEIRADVSQERKREVFLHELGHAVFEESGLRFLLSSKAFWRAFDPMEREEIITRIFVRHYSTALAPLESK